MKSRNKFKRNVACIYRGIEGKIVVLDPNEGKLFDLNKTASKLWSFLWKPRTKKELLQYLYKNYDIDSDKAKKDIKDFVKNSLKEKLLIRIN